MDGIFVKLGLFTQNYNHPCVQNKKIITYMCTMVSYGRIDCLYDFFFLNPSQPLGVNSRMDPIKFSSSLLVEVTFNLQSVWTHTWVSI